MRRSLPSLLFLPLSLLLALCLGGASPGQAQTRTVTGTVTDIESSEPLRGAQLTVKGQPQIGALARDNGTFSINVPTSDVVLVVRRIGYPLREVPVSASTSRTS